MFAKRFTHDLHDRFGPAGIVVWVAFLCACKRNDPPGRVRMSSELDGLTKLHLYGWELVDNKGEAWSLTDFFDFTGRKKQTRRVAVQLSNTRRIADQRLLDVCATHWERWQDDSRIDAERLRKRRWWAENRVADTSSDTARGPLGDVATRRADNDNDNDISPYPTSELSTGPPLRGAEPPAPPSNSRAAKTNPRVRGTNPRNHRQEAERVAISDWTGDEPTETVDLRPAVETLRAALAPPPPPRKHQR